MIEKPEIFVCMTSYGEDTEYTYQRLAEKIGELEIEILNHLVTCVYKDGVKDGIQFYEELDTR